MCALACAYNGFAFIAFSLATYMRSQTTTQSLDVTATYGATTLDDEGSSKAYVLQTILYVLRKLWHIHSPHLLSIF